jgi:hypothetical protein
MLHSSAYSELLDQLVLMPKDMNAHPAMGFAVPLTNACGNQCVDRRTCCQMLCLSWLLTVAV